MFCELRLQKSRRVLKNTQSVISGIRRDINIDMKKLCVIK